MVNVQADALVLRFAFLSGMDAHKEIAATRESPKSEISADRHRSTHGTRYTAHMSDAAPLQDQPDTLAMLRASIGTDVLCNDTSGRYLSDHIEELIAARVASALAAQ